MTNVKCDTCSKKLLEDELEENRSKHMIPFPGMPKPHERECKMCFFKRADFDGPNNNFWPNHEKDQENHDAQCFTHNRSSENLWKCKTTNKTKTTPLKISDNEKIIL